jgi:hypothetical protein
MSDNFWGLSDGEDASASATSEFDAGGGKFELIPDGTSVLAAIEEAKWSGEEKARYISLRMTIFKPEELEGRKFFHKLWVSDNDPNAKDPEKKRDKALRMLAAIDLNAGGKLLAKGGKPSDEALTLHLTNKPMVMRVGLWEVNGRMGDKIRGNNIGAVSPKNSPTTTSEEFARLQAASSKSSSGAASRQRNALDDDSIPFAPCMI